MKKVKLPNNKYALVDDEDFEALNKYSWRFMGRYVVRHQLVGEYTDLKDRKIVMMHRAIMNPPKELLVDHINHNTLDNRKSNLRLATPQQNSFNRRGSIKSMYSAYKGVSYHKNIKRWTASIKISGKKINLGTFPTEIAAAKAYKEIAKIMQGEFALK